MSDADRNGIADAARQIASRVQAGDAGSVKSLTVPAVAANFDAIAQGIQNVSGLTKGATLTVDAVYALHAKDAKVDDPETQFFCGADDSPARVTFTIPQLPSGEYAFALVHATGVPKPQQIAMLLARPETNWQLAGFFPRALTSAGHDGLWYWTRARSYAQKKQAWNAYFYFTTAEYLLRPANFLSSSNLEKLQGEAESAKPQGLPRPGTPMQVAGEGRTYSVTSMRTDDALGGLDLVLRYTATQAADPAAARADAVALMRLVAAQHPELRDGFHGLWVFADVAGGAPFALELPFTDIH